MTAPATHPYRFDLDVSPATLASLAATVVPILASVDTKATGYPDTRTLLRVELDLIIAELTELQIDTTLAKKMTEVTEWREEIQADRVVLLRRAQHLRHQLAAPPSHDGASS